MVKSRQMFKVTMIVSIYMWTEDGPPNGTVESWADSLSRKTNTKLLKTIKEKQPQNLPID
jgi:hypothetical protein